ncbi:MAG: TIM barrel protein [Candidatus Latescibacteria bacterium]|jgi:sugar phosphate isomerase/epimerase|nr:TIM barrel protein [Candidatus Latescibacterota bacterium]
MVRHAFSERMGVSTLCLAGLPLTEAIERTLEAGFAAFELTPITYGGPEAFGDCERRELRRRLDGFKLVTVHSSGMRGANICSAEAAHRQRSRERFRCLLELAQDLGADLVTFHPGRQAANGPTEEEVRAENIAFGRDLVARLDGPDMKLGYEFFDAEVVGEIGSPDFGLLFDIGHACRLGPKVDTDDVITMIDELASQTVQLHVHGVCGPDKTDHLALSEDTWLDYGRIARHVERLRLRVPMIFEIGIRTEDWRANLKDCADARDTLVQAVG